MSNINTLNADTKIEALNAEAEIKTLDAKQVRAADIKPLKNGTRKPKATVIDEPKPAPTLAEHKRLVAEDTTMVTVMIPRAEAIDGGEVEQTIHMMVGDKEMVYPRGRRIEVPVPVFVELHKKFDGAI